MHHYLMKVESIIHRKRVPMSNESRDPVVELDRIRLEIEDVMRDNMIAFVNSIRKIELILIDIDERLKALE